MHKGKKLLLCGAIGLIIGAFLPWATITSVFGEISEAGIEGDGIFTVTGGVILLLIALSNKKSSGRYCAWPACVLGLLIGWLLINDYLGIKAADNDASIYTNVGNGMYLSLLGALLAIIGGFTKNPPAKEEEAADGPPAYAHRPGKERENRM